MKILKFVDNSVQMKIITRDENNIHLKYGSMLQGCFNK